MKMKNINRRKFLGSGLVAAASLTVGSSFACNQKQNNMNQDPELKIKELGLVLPPAPQAVGLYKHVLVVDNFLYVSGQGPTKPDGSLITGTLGQDMDVEEGQLAARQVGLTMLSTIREHFGELNRIYRIIKVLGMVNSTPSFTQHPSVINGFSGLMAEVFGPENGIGTRSAVGMMLPFNIAVEVEAVFELYRQE